MKAITPIISTTILLLITVAIAGAAWFYVSGFYELYTSKVIGIPPGGSYFDGKYVSIMVKTQAHPQ